MNKLSPEMTNQIETSFLERWLNFDRDIPTRLMVIFLE